MELLPARYLEAMGDFLGQEEFENYKSSIREEHTRGLRLNPLKVPPWKQAAVLRTLFSEKQPKTVPWSLGEGYYYEKEKAPGKHPYYYAGLYYLQEPSAMAPAALLPIEPEERVLDLCAAPGGKSTALGARLKGAGLLVSNDVSVSRGKGLLKNLELFGLGNCLVTAEEPERLAACFPEFFDKILVDAPCSGEGMFRREPSMAEDWKMRGPEYYAPIQRELLFLASRMLKPGGMLLYSTCTFSEKEDEGAVAWLLKEVPDMEQPVLLADYGFVPGRDGASVRLYPWKLKGEGHFAAVFRKKKGLKEDGRLESGNFRGGKGKTDEEKQKKSNEIFLKRQEGFAAFRKRILAPLEERGFYWERNGELYLLPVSPKALPSLRYLRTGLHLGTVKRERFEPSQALALYLKKEEFSSSADFSLEDIRTVKYLKGETVTVDGALCSGEDGWCLVCVDGWPLGFAKRGGETLKNKYYPGWRWK
ncbi:MAG: SAM-dependent methyltransferase [Lachnospiraceae bacterium]|jgi:16S rRNA C967 or C1407 C5-methylase (RsmB/RsmF family)/NOL1/NOP2/fmu family ribosome biogenesis protein|nr:SAM-dependent methyltransferase [Lachnospiraceae bacterium]